jgi:hypothetical protein
MVNNVSGGSNLPDPRLVANASLLQGTASIESSAEEEIKSIFNPDEQINTRLGSGSTVGVGTDGDITFGWRTGNLLNGPNMGKGVYSTPDLRGVIGSSVNPSNRSITGHAVLQGVLPLGESVALIGSAGLEIGNQNIKYARRTHNGLQLVTEERTRENGVREVTTFERLPEGAVNGDVTAEKVTYTYSDEGTPDNLEDDKLVGEPVREIVQFAANTQEAVTLGEWSDWTKIGSVSQPISSTTSENLGGGINLVMRGELMFGKSGLNTDVPGGYIAPGVDYTYPLVTFRDADTAQPSFTLGARGGYRFGSGDKNSFRIEGQGDLTTGGTVQLIYDHQ